jgi:tetratricopeptide (TPR) repeat protein
LAGLSPRKADSGCAHGVKSSFGYQCIDVRSIAQDRPPIGEVSGIIPCATCLAHCMRTLRIGPAAKEIKQACLRAKERSEPPPFSLVVGAGLSHPPVLLASQIVEHCRQEASRWGTADDTIQTAPVDVYSYWFGKAYPQAFDRQTYLREMMEKAHISRANFRLAHLLLEGTISQIVVTPNFDDLLSRALTLFGRHPVVCDHPQTVERISVEARDVQIVHVHGTYWFYDCANLKEEFDRVAHSAQQEAFTMSSLLDDIFRSRVPLVIGYSGWEGDVIMGALKRRIAKPLPRNIYWFCYRAEELAAMPDWLTNHPNFVAVVPDQSEGSDIDSSDRATTLDATRVLDTLIQELGLAAPELTRDPLGFFAQQLRQSLWTDEAVGSDDVYAIRALIERVERARELEIAPAIEQPDLEAMREALRRSDHRQAIRRARLIDLGSLEPTVLREIATSTLTAAESLLDDSDDELLGYSLAVEASDLAGQAGHDGPLGLTVSQALLYRGLTLGTLKRSTDAIAAYDEVVRRFGDASDPPLREQVAKALINKGVTLSTLNRSDDAVASYDEVVRRFGDASDPPLRERVAKALVNKGITLGKLNRGEDEVTAYDEVLRRFGDASDPPLREPVARALVNKGMRLGTLKRSEDALAADDEVVHRFGDAADPPLRQAVARALINKGVTLGTLNRGEDAVASYDEVVRRFGDASDPPLRERVAKALVNKGIALGKLNGGEDEVAAYDEVLRRFGDASDPPLREQVATALVNKGAALGTLNRSEDEVATYDEVLRRFGNAADPPLREQVARALVNKGVTLGTLGSDEDEVATYDEVVRLFGDASDPQLREHVATALVNKGITLGKLNRGEDEVAAYDEILRRFRDASDPPLREHVATALVNKGVALGTLSRSEDEVATYDEVLHRFGDASDPSLRETVAKALVNKGITLGTLNRNEDEVASYDEVVRRFGDTSDPPLREQVAKALVNKGIALSTLNRSEDAVATFDEVVRRFGEASDPPLREAVATALTYRDVTLGT